MRENVRARLRVMVNGSCAVTGICPIGRSRVTRTVLVQAALLSEKVSVV